MNISKIIKIGKSLLVRKATTFSFSLVLFSLTILWSNLLEVQPVFGSTLSNLAASMQPGTWAALTTSGFNNGAVLRPPATGSILEYTDKAGSWNPLNGTVLVLGGSHPNGGPGGLTTVFAKYTESTNTWVKDLPSPVPTFDDAFGGIGVGHEYHHDTIVAATGDYYHRQYYSGKVMKFSHATQTWSQCSVFNAGGAYQVAGALEYFPDRNSLVYLDGDWGVWELSLASGNCTGGWTQRASTIGGGFSPQLTGLFSYSNQSRYSPRCQCIIMGGGNGSRKLYRYNANGTFAAIADAPVPIAIPQAGAGTIFTVDPVSGLILVWNYSNASTTLYEYDPVINAWTPISRTSPIFPGPEGGVTETAAVPISNYGVIMFVQAGSSSGGSVYLYKHSAGSGTPIVQTPTPTPTAIPQAATLIASPTSGTTFNPAQVVIVTGSGTSLSWDIDLIGDGLPSFKTGVGSSITFTVPTYARTSNLIRIILTGDGGTVTRDYSIVVPTQTTTPTPTPTPVVTPSPALSDFQTRCSQPGVVRCVGFDSSADITGQWGINPQGSVPNPGLPTIDSSIKASGNGSMKFVIPPGAAGGSAGSFFANFSDDLTTQFGGNSEFFVQWRMRIDDNFYAATQRRAGMKHAIIGTGSRPGAPVSSCTDLELVVQNNGARGFPQMYHSCSGGPINYEAIFDDRYGPYDFKLQNARPSPYCLYSQGQTTPVSYFPPTGNCFGYFANEWVTFQLHVKLGPLQQIGSYWYFTNSTVDLWLAREGQPSELAISAPGRNLEVNDDPLQKYGQIWLLPYSGGDTYPQGGTAWYDELIISTSKLPDPNSVATPGIQPPAAPTGLTLK